MSPPEWISVPEAARRLGVHYETLRRWIAAGRVPVRKFPDALGKVFVLASWLEGPKAEEPAKKPRRKKGLTAHEKAVKELQEAGLM